MRTTPPYTDAQMEWTPNPRRIDGILEHMIGKNKKWVAYVLFGILVAAGLLFYRFPSEAIRDYLEAKVDRINPQWALSIEQVSPSVTLGLKLLKAQLYRQASPERFLLRADALSLRLSLWSLLKGELKFCFDGFAYDGVLEGCTSFEKTDLASPFTTSLTLKDVRVGEEGSVRGLLGRNIKGILRGTITYRGRSDRLIGGTGEADLNLTDGQLELLQPILTMNAIDFNTVSIKMILKNRRVNLSRVELKGRNMRGTVSGIVSLRREIMNSRLDLRGTIEPFADFFKSLAGTRDTVKLFRQRLKRGTLSFTVRGTLKEPRIKFM